MISSNADVDRILTKSWLIGFTEAKGYFFFSLPTGSLPASLQASRPAGLPDAGMLGCGVPGMGEEDITHKFKIKKKFFTGNSFYCRRTYSRYKNKSSKYI